MVYCTPDIFLQGKIIGFEANGLSLITWQNATLFPASLAYVVMETIFYSIIDYEQEEPKRTVGKATKREKYLHSYKSDHVPCPPNYTHSKLFFAWRTKFESHISNYKAFWKLALPFSCSSVSTTYLYKFCLPELSTELCPPAEYGLLLHIFMPSHLPFPLLKPPAPPLEPGFWWTPTHSERELPSVVLREPPKQLPTPFCMCQPSTYRLLHHCIYSTSL